MVTAQNTSLQLPEAWAVVQDFFLGKISMVCLQHHRRDACVHPCYAKPQSMAYIGTGKQVELLKIFSEKCAVLKKPQCIMKRHSCWKEQSCHGCCEGHLAELAGGAGEPAPRSTALLWEQRRCWGSQPADTRWWPGWGGRGQPLEGAGGIWECMVGLERSNGWEKGHKRAW